MNKLSPVALPSLWEAHRPALFSELRKYVAKLIVTFDDDKTGKRKSVEYSAFFASVDGIPYLVSAGHCLREIKEILKQFTDVRMRVLDGLHNDQLSEPLPVGLNPDAIVEIDDRNTGADFGVMLLRPLYAHGLSQSGSQFIGDAQTGSMDDDWDLFCVLGFPEEFNRLEATKRLSDERIASESQLFMLPIEEKQNPKPEHYDRRFPRFLGTLLAFGKDPDYPKNIKGMSGGPLFAIRFPREPDQSLFVQLLGIQSTWYEQSKTIAAIPFHPVVALLKGIAEQALAGCPSDNPR